MSPTKKTGLTQQFNQQRWAKTSNRCGLYNDDIIIITITIIVVMYIYIYIYIQCCQVDKACGELSLEEESMSA